MDRFHKTQLLLTIGLLQLAACGRQTEPAAPSENPSPPQPQSLLASVFAPEVVSTDLPEFAVSFSPDSQTTYFNRASADRSQLTLMTADRRDGGWEPAEALPFSGEFRDVDPFLSADGSRLYFSSDRPSGLEAPGFDTWWVELRDGEWGTPFRPGMPLNSDATEVFVSASEDGTVYFGSDRDGTMRAYSSALEAGEYLEATPVPFDVNLAEGVGNPLISKDGTMLFFVSEREGSLGASDLYVTIRQGENWGPAQHLAAPANSPYADFAPALSPDGATLYFTSERPGVVQDFPEGERRPGDIFQVSLEAVLP